MPLAWFKVGKKHLLTEAWRDAAPASANGGENDAPLPLAWPEVASLSRREK